MRIAVVSAVGRGATLLSAFDAALHGCGVHSYNLIPLSSVIPPGSEVVPVERYAQPSGEYGHRLYVVKSEARSDRAGTLVAAALGWYQWGEGRGVFVEHETVGWNREMVAGDVDRLVRHSLRDICRIRDVRFLEHEVRTKVIVAEAGDQPTCALVLAVYQADAWHDPFPSANPSTARAITP